MKLFGQIVRTVVNTAVLPVAVAKDMVTLGGALTDEDESAIVAALKRLKREAAEDPDEDE